MRTRIRGLISGAVVAALLFGLAMSQTAPAGAAEASDATATPIKHLVVIFGEKITFDHYFGTYPIATNPSGEPRFNAVPGTPNVNGLNGALLTVNPNFLNTANGTGAANPFRLDRSQNLTSDSRS